MSKNTWIVWALFLLLPGAVGLSIHFALNDSLDSRITQAAERSTQNTAAEEYLQMYENWSNLPGDEKANNPWGHGEYGGSEIQERLQNGQVDRLLADLPVLEKGLTHYPDQLADVIYGLGWEQAIEEYKQERAAAEIVLIASTFLLAGGGLFLVGGFIKLLVLRVIKKRSEDDEEGEQECEDSAFEDSNQESQTKTSLGGSSPLYDSSKNSESSVEAGDLNEDSPENTETEPVTAVSEESGNKGYFETNKNSDSKPGETGAGEMNQLPMKPTGSKSAMAGKPQKDSYFGWAIDTDDSTDFETLMTTEPLTKELTELTEEVSAIRQYAAQQQDQMRKLQDGYDWMIIRRFCLRVIRCIDNIEDRMAHVEAQDQTVSECLEDIRDELVFALESSGIEQYKPDLNMSFKGLEKYAEAVRERAFTEDADLIGCIAEVTRPGYQYLVNDDNVKIVRCAQVKLYETN